MLLCEINSKGRLILKKMKSLVFVSQQKNLAKIAWLLRMEINGENANGLMANTKAICRRRKTEMK